MKGSPPVREIRIAVAVDDFDAALAFYMDGLGLPIEKQWEGEDGRGVVFAVGRGSLEVVDPREAESIDLAEVGEIVGAPVRMAVRVDGVDEANDALIAAGASSVAGPVNTPWGGRSARLRTPDGMQLTLFADHPVE